jgi:hypothetical protein
MKKNKLKTQSCTVETWSKNMTEEEFGVSGN